MYVHVSRFINTLTLFQTILAAYFCSVDFMLFSQYFYYARRTPTAGSRADDASTTSRYTQSRRLTADPDHSHVHYREISSAAADLAVVAAIAADDEAGLGRHVRSRNTSSVGPHRMHVPVLSEGTTIVSPVSDSEAVKAAKDNEAEQWLVEEDDEVDDSALAALADSFHSEHGGRGLKRVSWSQERVIAGGGGPTRGRASTTAASLSRSRARPHSTSPLIGLRTSLSSHSHHNAIQSPQAISTLDFPTSVEQGANVAGTGFGVGLGLTTDADVNTNAGDQSQEGLNRGRPLRRQVIDSPIDDPDVDLERQAPSTNVSSIRGSTRETAARRNSRASKRSAGLVFLGVWALVGIGGLSGRLRGRSVIGSSTGVVFSEVDAPTEWPPPPLPAPHHDAYDPSNLDIILESFNSLVNDEQQEPPEEASPEQILGRISAWTCTTLYLTSRLPQIWKNVRTFSASSLLFLISLSQFARKSVEGLSMYLFIFAFLGNTFYVLSILSSPRLDAPKPEAIAFIKESVP